MAAAQTAEQKAAAQAEADRIAAEQAAVAAAAEQKAAEEPAPTKQIVVVGAAVVLATVDKSERYLYRRAVVDAAPFTEDSVQRALDIGLIEIVK